MKGSLILLIAAVFPLCWLLSARASDLGVIDVRYDKFDDITKVSTVESKISDALGRRQENQDLRFKVAYECTGETTHCRPERVEFRFLSQSVGEYTGSDQLIFIGDGKANTDEAFLSNTSRLLSIWKNSSHSRTRRKLKQSSEGQPSLSATTISGLFEGSPARSALQQAWKKSNRHE